MIANAERFELTVRPFAEPGQVLARAVVAEARAELGGDPRAWSEVPLLYVGYLRFAPWDDYVLFRVSPAAGRIDVQRLEWFDDGYDKLYQSVVDVVELFAENLALVSVQRSSRVIVHDLATGKQTGAVDLAGRNGNPRLHLRGSGQEIWASDYDTLAVIRRRDRRMVRSARLQGALTGTGQFIGDHAFAPDEEMCVVARPFSGDVVGIDPASLRIKRTVRLGRQPLEVAALGGGEVPARDWKTGEMSRGVLKRRRWFSV